MTACRFLPLALVCALWTACPSDQPHRYVQGLSYDSDCALQLCWYEAGVQHCERCDRLPAGGIWSDGTGPSTCEPTELPAHANTTLGSCGSTSDAGGDATDDRGGDSADAPDVPDTSDVSSVDTVDAGPDAPSPDVTEADVVGPDGADGGGDVEPVAGCGQFLSCLSWCDTSSECFLTCFPPADPGCLACSLEAIGTMIESVCSGSPQDAACVKACATDASPFDCAEGCGFATYGECLTAGLDTEAASSAMEASCGFPLSAPWCAACAAQGRLCDRTDPVGQCGPCKAPLVEDASETCQSSVPCPVFGCGTGECNSENVCECSPGSAPLIEGSCVSVAGSNPFVPVLTSAEVPATFFMGSDAVPEASPCHEVTMATPFALQAYEVTRSQFAACVAAGACQSLSTCEQSISLSPNDRPNHPVSCVTHAQATQYCTWINARLPSEAEWAFAAHGSGTCPSEIYTWGTSTIAPNQANYAGSDNPFAHGSGPLEINGGPTTPVGFFDGTERSQTSDGWLNGPETYATVSNEAFNAPGIFDLTGNVEEVTADCWHPSYQDAPTDGTAWKEQNCSEVVRRGGNYQNDATVEDRNSQSIFGKEANTGFRCATNL